WTTVSQTVECCDRSGSGLCGMLLSLSLFDLDLVVGLILVSYASACSAVSIRSPVTIHVIEHPNTDAVIDTGVPGDTTGDLLTFHNPIFNATNSTRAGRDQGDCIRISPRLGTWECRWLTQIQGQGSIMVEGA